MASRWVEKVLCCPILKTKKRCGWAFDIAIPQWVPCQRLLDHIVTFRKKYLSRSVLWCWDIYSTFYFPFFSSCFVAKINIVAILLASGLRKTRKVKKKEHTKKQKWGTLYIPKPHFTELFFLAYSPLGPARFLYFLGDLYNEGPIARSFTCYGSFYNRFRRLIFTLDF